MASAGKITVEVSAGPTLRAGLDVLDLAAELIDLIPDWHKSERAALLERCTTLQETMLRELKNPQK